MNETDADRPGVLRRHRPFRPFGGRPGTLLQGDGHPRGAGRKHGYRPRPDPEDLCHAVLRGHGPRAGPAGGAGGGGGHRGPALHRGHGL